MKYSIIGLKDLRENTESYIAKIQKGRSFMVIKRSKPVFKISPVDVWGDEGTWETVVDFRDIDKKGISIERLMKSFKTLRG